MSEIGEKVKQALAIIIATMFTRQFIHFFCAELPTLNSLLSQKLKLDKYLDTKK